MTGRRHPKDVEGDLPPSSTLYLWKFFHEITRGRPVSAMGTYLPIPSTEILAWSTLAKVELLDWELDVIRQLDNVFLKVMASKD